MIYENIEKKHIHFTTQTSICMGVWVTDILKFYEVVFYTYCTGYVLSLKNSHYPYIPPYMHKTFPAIGNEKEQQQILQYINFTVNFTKKCWVS